MTPDDWDFGQGLKLAGVAVVCAILTATVVIALGEAALNPRPNSLQTSHSQGGSQD